MASYQWARLFHEHGHTSISICAPDSPLAEKLRSAGLPYREMDFRDYFSPRQTWKLRQLVITQGIDAVFLQSLKDLSVVTPALWGLPTRLIGFAQMWLSGISKKDLLHRIAYQRMDMMVTLTKRQGEQVLRCVPYPKEKTVVLPNSVDTTRFSQTERDLTYRRQFAKDSEILIGMVGRIDPQKGQRELLEAFSKVVQSNPTLPVKLILVGESTKDSGEKYYQGLLDFCTSHGLVDKVLFTGFRSDIPQVMAHLDIFILNSYQEAFGFVVVEALMSGAPVIATNSGGVPDILHEGEYGTLVPPRDVPQLAHAIEALAKNETLRRTIAQKAQAYALKEFDEQQTFKKLVQKVSQIEPRVTS